MYIYIYVSMNMCHINMHIKAFFLAQYINTCSHLQSRPPRGYHGIPWDTMGYHGIPRHQPQPTLNAVRRPESGSFPAGKIMKHLRILWSRYRACDVRNDSDWYILVMIFGHFMNISYEST